MGYNDVFYSHIPCSFHNRENLLRCDVSGSQYRIVVADSRYPRDGRFIEEIGTYDPMQEPSVVKVDAEKAKKWISNGAQPTDTVKTLFKKNGIL